MHYTRIWRLVVLSASLTVGGVCQTSLPGSDESGPPLIRNFTPKSYHASPQNWAVVQDGRGVVYVANTDCVLEYDGVSWRRIPIGNNLVTRSLAVDRAGRVFVGAQGDFGYLEPGSAGTTQYHSLTNQIPATSRKFSDVWSVIPTDGGVYFGTYQGIFLWLNPKESIRVWKPKGRFGRLMAAGTRLYVTTEGNGLYWLHGENLEPVPGGGELERGEVRNIMETPDGLMIATQKGLVTIENGTARRLDGGLKDALGGGAIYSAASLRSGMIAVATTLSGILFADGRGTLLRSIGQNNGLLGNSTTSLYEDREGGLWISSSAGIDRADLAMTRFASGEGLAGAAYGVVRNAGTVYAGTSQGLFSLANRKGVPGFEPVRGIQDPLFATLPTANGLVAGGQRGLYQVAGQIAKLVPPITHVYDLAMSRGSTDLLYAASRGGLNSFRWKGSGWVPDRSYPSSGEEFRSVLEDADGRIWVATPKDILRVDWRHTEGLVQSFGVPAGVPAGFKNIYRIRGDAVFATPKGLLKFDPAAARFVPWTVLGKEFADGSRPVSIVREVADGRVWITGEGYHGELRPKASGGWDWRAMPLGRADLAELYAVLPEADGTVWAAGTDGFLVRYSPAQQPPPAPFGVLVRRVQSQAGPILFDGLGALRLPPAVSYENNSLRFEFAAPYLQDPAKVEYQVKLEGADSAWSAWSMEAQKDYTHLFEGSYRFLVRARNPAGVLSQEVGFAFSIRPPWYRTWVADTIYLLTALGSIWGLFKWRINKLEAEKAELEQIVEERTVEIREQRDQIQVEQEKSETLLLNILPTSVAEELKASGTVQAQQYDEVTVCFTDFAGFTLSSESLPAGQLVSALHEYFTSFDEIVEEFGLEKLKTIGDAYMLVSGLPKPQAAHAVDAVLAALKMVDVVEELAGRGEGPVWQVRIGLHSGPVAAGVVGVRKFAFDIWGNTVNLASRMESSGSVGRVNLSESTWALVKDFIECEPRGHVQTKDKRDLQMYFAVGLKPELAESEVFVQRYRTRFGAAPGYTVPATKKVVL